MYEIPKIVHHIAPVDQNNWTPIWKPCYQSWLDNFEDHEHIMWDNENLREFVKIHFKEHLEFYDNLPFDIMRYDLGRLLLLTHFGGIYADMDVYCYKNFESFLDKEFKTISVSNYSNKRCWDGSKHIVESFLISSVPNNDFFNECIQIIKDRVLTLSKLFDKRPNTIFVPYCSGPYAFQQAYFNFYNTTDFLLPWELFSRDPNYFGEELYTRHMNTTTWTKWTAADNREWISNPETFNFFKNNQLISNYV